MKKIILIMFMSLFILTSCQNYNSQEKGNKDFSYEEGYTQEEHSYDFDFRNYELSNLSKKEIEAIYHMRQEEKLARDVYRTLYETTPVNVFYMIPISEEGHMDAFKQVIERYNLEDPIKDETQIGIYKDEKFTKLFNELTEKGKESDLEAFKVGAFIEDINMFNLIKYGKETDKSDLKYVYTTLLVQSKNHMRAFLRQLNKYDYNYVPQYISQEILDEVNSQKNRMNH